MNITISREILDLWPCFDIAALEFDAVYHSSDYSDEKLAETEAYISQHFSSLQEVLDEPRIAAARKAYKAFGKDPSRYRLAAESLHRRVVKGNTLYRISNLVDLGNVISVMERRSVAVLDADKIEGDILVRLGKTSDHYEGIGRGELDISNVPLYEDNVGPFGSTTSDTPRTMITENTHHVLLFIISFDEGGLDDGAIYTQKLYERYADATNFKRLSVRKEE